MKYLKCTDINLSEERLKIFPVSQFSALLNGMMKTEYLGENSTNLTLTICQNYINNKFMLNATTSISFCAHEVAKVLGIHPSGVGMELKKSSFATFVDYLKQNYSDTRANKEKEKIGDQKKNIDEKAGRIKRDISLATLKNILQRMPVTSAVEKTLYI